MEPTPLSSLFNESSIRQQIKYAADSNGELRIIHGPTCIDVMFMLPFPFLVRFSMTSNGFYIHQCLYQCLGCFISESSELVFNDRSQTLASTKYPGYLCCLKKDTLHEYTDIANIGYYTTNMKENKRFYLQGAVVLKDKRVLDVGEKKFDVSSEVLALHAFLFQRNKSHYVTPPIHSLHFKPPARACCCCSTP